MSVQDDIQTIVNDSNIEIGLVATQIETGETIAINGDVPFPMASVFKIPILVTAFSQIEQGISSLNNRITLENAYKSPGSGILPFFEMGLTPTWRDLLTLMIIISDNTATDIIVEQLGGPEVVESYLHQIGLNDIYFKMNCKDLLGTVFPEEAKDVSSEELEALIIEKGINHDAVAFSLNSDNNVSTARAMSQLVTMIFKDEIVSQDSRKTMLDILLQQQFNDRLPRFLPPSIKCAHKTGTIWGIRNDSGIYYISDDNHVAITLFTHWDYEAVWLQTEAELARIFEIETAMGQIGRLVFDHFNRV